MRARVTHTLLASLVVLALLAPGVAATQADARDADLVVQQPHYVETDVSTQSANGTTVYEAQGQSVDLYPQNFDAEDVVGFGSATPNGTVEAETGTGGYTLSVGGPGTYELYWIVEQPVVTNETANETVVQRVRYEAQVRISGQTGLVHREAGSLAGTREDAQKWREFNATIHDAGFVGPEGTEAAVQEMIRRNKLWENPTRALTGNVVAYLILGFTSTAILVWIFGLGGHAIIVRKLRRKLNYHEAVEAEEGTAKEALAELEQAEKHRNLQMEDWQDIPGFDDHVAQGFRDAFGQSLHDGTVSYFHQLRPRDVVRDRLVAMGHDGADLAITEYSDPGDPTDGGLDPQGIEAVTIHPEGAPDTERTLQPHEASTAQLDAVLDVLDWDAPALRTFELPAADYTVGVTGDLDEPPESMDIDTIAERIQADMQHFDDVQAFGEYIEDFLRAVEESPTCDDEGRMDGIQYVMNHLQKHAQYLDDGNAFPGIHYYREAIERALIDFDPEREARETVKRVRGGG